MRVEPTKRAILDDGRHRTSVRVTFDDGTRSRLWFTTSADIPFVKINVADIWLPPMLIVAMRRGETLDLVEPISQRAESLERIQDVLTTWYPNRMQRVAISAPPPQRFSSLRRLGRNRGRGVGSMFSGGVDSFHTLTKNRDRIDALLYGFGIDVPVRKTDAVERVRTLLAHVAAESGKQLLVADTNIRKFLKHEALWSRESHGAALASLATVFSTVIDRVLIPSTHTFAVSRPWGSHPLLDEHWSTQNLNVTHDGAEASRVQKIRAISDIDIAQRNLRVCYKQFTSLNCCRCPKCLRTMATLTALGRLDQFTAFHEPLDLDLLRSLEVGPGNSLIQVQWLHEHFVGTEHDHLAEVTGAMLQRHHERQTIAAAAD